jgi:signal transduction histidine kinase
LDTLISLGGQAAADRVTAVVQLVDKSPPAERPLLLRNLDTPGMRAAWAREPLVEEQSTDPVAEQIRGLVRQRLKVHEVRVAIGRRGDGGGFGGRGPGVGMGTGGPGGGGMGAGPGSGGMGAGGMGMGLQHRGGLGPGAPAGDAQLPPLGPGGINRMVHGVPFDEVVRIAVRLEDTSWINFVAPLDAVESLWAPRFVLSMAVLAVLTTVMLVLALRRVARPFATFARAAERLGVDVSAPPLAETGPREVRSAAHAFNVMQNRLRRFVEDRTQMLAAISHDLRTPITRMRLRAEFVEDDEEREKMLADLAEMEAMISATLAFARDDAAQEPRRMVDIAAMLQGLADDHREAGYDGPDHLLLQAKPTALKRALSNLVDNAIKYGGCAEIRLSQADGRVVAEICDNGPGIPPEEREKVFQPFYRLERSRSRDTGGTGLGLAIARTAIRGQGGDVVMDARPQGGLVARVTLPG